MPYPAIPYRGLPGYSKPEDEFSLYPHYGGLPVRGFPLFGVSKYGIPGVWRTFTQAAELNITGRFRDGRALGYI